MSETLRVEKLASLLKSDEEELFNLGIEMIYAHPAFTKIVKKLIETDQWMGQKNTSWNESVDNFVTVYNQEHHGRESEEHVAV